MRCGHPSSHLHRLWLIGCSCRLFGLVGFYWINGEGLYWPLVCIQWFWWSKIVWLEHIGGIVGVDMVVSIEMWVLLPNVGTITQVVDWMNMSRTCPNDV